MGIPVVRESGRQERSGRSSPESILCALEGDSGVFRSLVAYVQQTAESACFSQLADSSADEFAVLRRRCWPFFGGFLEIFAWYARCEDSLKCVHVFGCNWIGTCVCYCHVRRPVVPARRRRLGARRDRSRRCRHAVSAWPDPAAIWRFDDSHNRSADYSRCGRVRRAMLATWQVLRQRGMVRCRDGSLRPIGGWGAVAERRALSRQLTGTAAAGCGVDGSEGSGVAGLWRSEGSRGRAGR